jgi:predicted GIY-YIG superfamily endonuclease
MIRDFDNRLYVGVSEDPHKRLHDHNMKRGASFTKIGNFSIVFLEKYLTFSEARKRENQIKRWRREKKDFLINRYAKGLETKM